MKEKYTELELEIVEFEAEDIIITSPSTDGSKGNEGEWIP